MEMDRRKFLKLSAITAGVVAVGGGVLYAIKRDSHILDDHFEWTEKVLRARFGKDHAAGLIGDIRREYKALAPEMPYIGGEGNMFTECGICTFYRAHGAGELAPYLCLSDSVVFYKE